MADADRLAKAHSLCDCWLTQSEPGVYFDSRRLDPVCSRSLMMLADRPFDRFWLLTTTTYGSWLPGDERGFVSDIRSSGGSKVRHNRVGEDYDRDLPQLKRAVQNHLRGQKIVLARRHAELLEAQFQETALHRGWWLMAVAVMTTHVHLVTGAAGDPSPENLLRDYKSHGSRRLNQVFGKPVSDSWWTRSGSRRKLPTDVSVQAALRYVQQQKSPLLIWTDSFPEIGLCRGHHV